MPDTTYDFLYRNVTRLTCDVVSVKGQTIHRGTRIFVLTERGTEFSFTVQGNPTTHTVKVIGSMPFEKLVGAKYIILERAEGPTGECGKPVVVKAFEEASKQLRDWAHTAPKDGGYDKTDFVVVWKDGETYEGRVDLKREHSFGYDLREHIRGFWAFHAGQQKPPHLTQERYDAYLKQEGEGATAAAEALKRYDV